MSIINEGPICQLASRDNKKDDTIINVKGITLGGSSFRVIAGPCAVENEDQIFIIAQAVKSAGAELLRGGAYKPRTSPYSFQGLGEEGLKLLAQAGRAVGLPVVTEATDIKNLEKVAIYTDIIQIGARNMQNYSLLREAAATGKVIMLKRGFCATLEEWLLAAEYLLGEGNDQIVLCERGIRTFENYTRNTLDLAGAAAIKILSHLPIIIDPSHGTGRRELIHPTAKAACALGINGVMIEVHHDPDSALSDGAQSVTISDFQEIMNNLQKIKECLATS